MKRALIDLPVRPVRILIDGNRAPRLSDCFADCEVQTVVGGDALFACISAASILAKTHRDALMARLDARSSRLWPRSALRLCHARAPLGLVRLGPSAIHRASFNPLRSWLSGALPFGVLPAEAQLCSSEADEAALEDIVPGEACA